MIRMITIGRSRFIGTFDHMGAGPDGGVVTTGGLVVTTVVTSVTGSSVGIVVIVLIVPVWAPEPVESEGSVPDFRRSVPVLFVVGTGVIASGAM
jgi:hypothetical protein